MSNLGVVIVTHNSGAVIAECLRSLQTYAYPVLVVDNASADDTCELVRRFPVQLIANTTNRGFAGAANQGFEILQVSCILLLNPDVYITSDPGVLLPHFDSPDVAAVTALLTDSSATPEPSFQLRRLPTPLTLLFDTAGLNRLLPGNPVNRHYRYHGSDWTQPRDVEQPAGAYVLIRRACWRQVGGFDERFHPLWFEDVDFFHSLRAHGWRTRFLPSVAGRHVGAHSIRALDPGLRQLYWYRSLLQYAAKHFSGLWVRILATTVGIAAGVKTIFMATRTLTLKPLRNLLPICSLVLLTILTGRPSSGSSASSPTNP